MKPDIIISSHDLDRLEALLDTLPASMSSSKAALLEELNRAEIREPHEMPSSVVTMNSRVHFAVEPSGDLFSLTLSYSANVDEGPERLSVLSPVGAAILGLAVGAQIDWPGPNGATLRVRVLDVVEQPRPDSKALDRTAGGAA